MEYCAGNIGATAAEVTVYISGCLIFWEAVTALVNFSTLVFLACYSCDSFQCCCVPGSAVCLSVERCSGHFPLFIGSIVYRLLLCCSWSTELKTEFKKKSVLLFLAGNSGRLTWAGKV